MMQAVNEALEQKSINHIEFTRSEKAKFKNITGQVLTYNCEFLLTKQKTRL